MGKVLKLDSQLDAESAPGFAVKHYSPAELGQIWALSADTIRKLFEREPGVLVIGKSREAVLYHFANPGARRRASVPPELEPIRV